MRLWPKQFLSFLPQKQLCSQWRECCCIARNIAINGTTNHILVNKIMNYPPTHFAMYGKMVYDEMNHRGYRCDFSKFAQWLIFDLNALKADDLPDEDELFRDWHNYRYAVQCYFNLQEKFDCGVLTEDEWNTFVDGFQSIT